MRGARLGIRSRGNLFVVMHAIALYALRGLTGGGIVVAFALIGEALSPKAFAGLFAAAPSVAVVGLAITIASKGFVSARQASTGMVVGGIGMVVCCALAASAIPRIQALWGSLVAWLGWGVVSFGLYWAVFIGAR